jgi:hypothetical protein
MFSPSPNPVLVAHPLCLPHLRGLVEDTVQAFDNSWLLAPVEGEVFESGKGCLARLQGYALHKEVGWPLLKQLGQVPQRATLRTLLCLGHLRWQSSRREV